MVFVDYLQSLSDENKINVEKIGSGNWYWSFVSQDTKTRQKALEDAQAAYNKADAVNEDLKQKLAEAQAQRADEEDMLDDGGESREELTATKVELESEVKLLRKELAAYSDDDPTELERKKKETQGFKADAEQYSEEIYSMEGWFKNAGTDEESMNMLRMSMYGDEFDAEEGGLKELV